jgi:hypothetical protein
MLAALRGRLTYANVMATVAVFVALGGSSYAALSLPKKSVGTKQLKRNAVTSSKVRNGAITGADVNESSFGQVPSAATAANATNATNAGHATNADQATNAGHATNADKATNAGSATTAGIANAAFSTYHDDSIPLPDSSAPLATLNIPTPGNYVVNAKFVAHNVHTAAGTNPFSACDLVPDVDVGAVFDVDNDPVDDDEVIALQGVKKFTTSGQITLKCTDYGWGNVVAQRMRITAVQVAHLTNTSF